MDSNLIGYGSFGSVFKGCLRDETKVTVKVLNMQITGSWKIFVAECEALSNVRPRILLDWSHLASALTSRIWIFWLWFMSIYAMEARRIELGKENERKWTSTEYCGQTKCSHWCWPKPWISCTMTVKFLLSIVISNQQHSFGWGFYYKNRVQINHTRMSD